MRGIAAGLAWALLSSLWMASATAAVSPESALRASTRNGPDVAGASASQLAEWCRESGLEYDENASGSTLSAKGGAPRADLISVLRERVRQQAGFRAEGRPLILDENVTSQALLDGLRARGHNVRSVREIFGRFGTDDADIIKVADVLDAKVITNNVKDFGRPRTVPLPRPGKWAVDTVERLIGEHAR